MSSSSSSSSSSLALGIFSACALAACAASGPDGDGDVGASTESALASIPDVRPKGTGCLARRSGAGSEGDRFLRIEFHGIDQVDSRRPDKIVVRTFREDGAAVAASRGDGDYDFNTLSALKQRDGSVAIYRGGSGSLDGRLVAVLKPEGPGDAFVFQTRGTLYPSMPNWANQRVAAVCNFEDAAKFPPIPGQTAAEVTLAPVQDISSDFAFPRPLRPMVCRASERTKSGLRLEIAITPSNDRSGGGSAGMATIRAQDAGGFTRELASTLFVRRGLSDSTLGLENVQSARFGEIRTSVVSFSPRTTYGIFYEPPLASRLPELGREKVRLNCQE